MRVNRKVQYWGKSEVVNARVNVRVSRRVHGFNGGGSIGGWMVFIGRGKMIKSTATVVDQ